MPERMTEDDLRARLAGELSDAREFVRTKIRDEQERNLDYYHQEPLGTEVAGRSTVVLPDVEQVIESMLPDVLRVFTGSDTPVEFRPHGPEDVEVAEQQTDVAHHIVNEQNDGFRIQYDWVKAALVEKVAALKAWWEEDERVSEEVYEGKTIEELVLLDQNPEVEFLEAEESESSTEAQPYFDVKVRRTRSLGRVRIEGIPNEEFVVDRDARCVGDARLIGHVRTMTRSELLEMGFDEAEIDRIPKSHGDQRFNDLLKIARDDLDQQSSVHSVSSPEWASEKVDFAELYFTVDADGDGRTELRRILAGGAGSGMVILENEVTDHKPFAVISAIREPHKFFGRAVADLVVLWQKVRSTIFRQFLDNLYRINNGAYYVQEGVVELDDLLSTAPVRVVRGNAPANQAITPLPVPEVGRGVFEALEFSQVQIEQATGQSRLNQGQDARAFGKTAFGTNALLSKAQGRLELVVRVLAETGYRDLYRLVLQLLAKHQTKAQVMRLRNAWVPVDPSLWDTMMDVSVKVGLSTTSRDILIGQLQQLIGMQAQALQSGARVATEQNLYEALLEVTRTMGFADAERFWTNPEELPPAAPPQPDPTKVLEIQARTQGQQQDRQLRAIEMAEKDDRERRRMDLDFLDSLLKPGSEFSGG